MLELKDTAGQGLTQSQDGTASEIGELHQLAHFLAHLIVILHGTSFAQGNLHIGILHLAIGHYGTVAIDFKVSLIGIHNHVIVLVRTINLGNHAAEAFLQHAHQSGSVNVLSLLELCERVNEIYCLICLCCHYILILFLSSI